MVDDDASTRTVMAAGLGDDGYEVRTAASAEEALPLVMQERFDAVVTDVVMGGMSGIALLRKIRDVRPALPVVVITGYGSVESAVEAMREGAADYLPKPTQFDQLGRVLRRLVRRAAPRPAAEEEPGEMLGQSEAIRRVLRLVASVANTDVTVLVRGESGTGKELVARAIHAGASQRRGPLVTVNCAAITESLAESELFGHEKGAFTGAIRLRKGKVEMADGGTLFLDEVGDLAPALQTKLLRVLQERVFERVGGGRPIRVDVRVVAATNRDIEAMVADGRFREDLYYRLNVVEVAMPPLRERVEDVPLLTQHFLATLSARHGLPEPPTVGRGVMDALRAHVWPGNVRELRNVIEQLVVTTGREKGRVGPSDLPSHISAPARHGAAEGSLLDGTHSLGEIETTVIQRTLSRTGGNKAEAARILGIGLKTLYRRLSSD